MKTVLLLAVFASPLVFATQVSKESIENIDAQLQKQGGVVGSCTQVSLKLQPHKLAGEDFEGELVLLSYTMKDGKTFEVPNMYVNGKSRIKSSVRIDDHKKITETIKIMSYSVDNMFVQVGNPSSTIAFIKEDQQITNIVAGWGNTLKLKFNRFLFCSK